jgi:hypothetical protein
LKSIFLDYRRATHELQQTAAKGDLDQNIQILSRNDDFDQPPDPFIPALKSSAWAQSKGQVTGNTCRR